MAVFPQQAATPTQIRHCRAELTHERGHHQHQGQNDGHRLHGIDDLRQLYVHEVYLLHDRQQQNHRHDIENAGDDLSVPHARYTNFSAVFVPEKAGRLESLDDQEHAGEHSELGRYVSLGVVEMYFSAQQEVDAEDSQSDYQGKYDGKLDGHGERFQPFEAAQPF